MSDLSNNLAILTYLKDKVHKWKNISIILGIAVFLLLAKTIFGSSISGGSVEGGLDYIAKIKIAGEISEDDYRSETLKKILEENAIKAVIVEIDSPGGTIVGSEILFTELRKIALKKPTVVLMNSLAASGGYMAAIAADHIVAHNGTLTGSIGVLMQSAEFTDLANKVGVKFNTYKSAPLKAAPSPFEKSNAMVDQVIGESIKDSAEFFFELVKERRREKLNKREMTKIFDGRIFNGRQALKAGLIDEVGGIDQVLAYLKTQKIDADKLEIKEVGIVKIQDNFLHGILGNLPFQNFTKMQENKGIMAVMDY